jgi:hypothetical protein
MVYRAIMREKESEEVGKLENEMRKWNINAVGQQKTGTQR